MPGTDAAPAPAGDTGAAVAAEPTVVVDDVYVNYRVVVPADSNRRPGVRRSMVSRVFTPRRVQTIEAVRGVSFTAYRGDVIGLIGSNGSGKSTLLRAIAGLVPLAKGAIYAVGQPALLGVNAALVQPLSGAHNIELGCLALGLSTDEVRDQFPKIVKFSGIRADRINLPMRTYSSGMASRLRFAIAQAAVPDVLLIDEALATGDRRFKRRSERRIGEIRKETGTVFVVSHSNADIRKTCTRAIWLEDGELQMDGAPDEVIAAYEAATEDD